LIEITVDAFLYPLPTGERSKVRGIFNSVSPHPNLLPGGEKEKSTDI